MRGWTRRFWQGSHDHRGVPDAPGRVVTLVASPGEICAGMAYQVDDSTLPILDHREKNGYRREHLSLLFEDGSETVGIVYVADPANPAFLGPAPDQDIAAHIAGSAGPSGRNIDYLLDLSNALRELGIDDDHVFALADLVALDR